MTPFSIQTLVISARNISFLKNNLCSVKYKFCLEFEKEMKISESRIAEEIFDFIYNIHDHQRVFKGKSFNQILSNFMDMDFQKQFEVLDFINDIYKQMAFYNRDYFYEIFRFNHEDPKHIAETFGRDLQGNIDKFIKHF